MPEIWDLYDENQVCTGQTMQRGEPIPVGMYHLVVHIWLLNKRGEFLIQRRAQTLAWKPGVWAATGGSAIAGEDARTAARRELFEELGYRAKPEELRQVACLHRTDSFCYVYVVRADCPEEAFTLLPEEVDAVKWCSCKQILSMVAERAFYNYGDAYFNMLIQYQRTQR